MISYAARFDFEDAIEKIRAQVIRGIEESALDAAIRRQGYVRPVMCRDCEYFDPGTPIPGCSLLDFGVTGQAEGGFCAWGMERGGA